MQTAFQRRSSREGRVGVGTPQIVPAIYVHTAIYRLCCVVENRAKGNDRGWLGRTSGSHALVEQHSVQVREEAQHQVAAAQATLASAEAAIAQLEAETEEQAQRLASQEQTIIALRDELAQARSATQVAEARAAEQARQVEELQRQTQQREVELTQTRTIALDQARLEGEVTALQRQLGEQTALVERLARESRNRKAGS